MAEYCYSSVCGHGEVDQELQSEFTIDICQSLRRVIAEAGGSGALEATPCPHLVMRNLQHQETDTVNETIWKMQMTNRLGIVGFASINDLD